MKMRKHHGTVSLTFLACTLFLILGPGAGLSNPMLGTPDARSMPYDEGETDNVPSAAARICNLVSSPVSGGCHYSFDIEVFSTSWKPVCEIRLDQLADTVVDPASWPTGWVAEQTTSTFQSPASLVFSTPSDPIQPGEVLAGFGMVSYSGRASLRWYPADSEGILLGKITRLELECATASEGNTWGSIKAIYR